MEKGTFCESLGGFFPSFALSYFSFKRWDLAFYYGIFECLVLIFVSNFKAQSLICAVCVYTLAVYIAEKDTRDLWINCTSVSSQHTQYRDMFNISHNGIFVIDKDGNILNYNKKAAVIAQINGKTEEMLQYCKFYDIFDDDHRVWAKNIISTAMAGEKRSEEFICRKTSNLTAEDIQNLGFVLKTDLVNWNDEIAIRISFIDISTAVANRLLIINCYKRIQSSTEKLLKESIKIFEASNLITPNFISKLNTIVHDLRTQLIYQGHLISRVELKAEFLNLFAELNNVIELLYVKAEDKGLVINLNGANLLPKCVIGDKSFHNQMLNSIIEYLISKANMTSVIDITIIRNSISTNQVTIQYEFEFTSDLLKLQELDQLFQVRREGTRRKSFLGYVSMFKNDETGMFMFDMIVCLLRGFLDFNIDKNKGFISIFVPYMIAEKEPNCVIFCLHEKPLEKDPEVYTWHPKIDKIRKPKKNDKLRNRVLSPDIGSFDLDMSESSEQPGPDSFSSHSELLTSEDEENHNFETTDFSSSNFRLSMSTPIPSET